jgi:hypothetical protein
MHKATITRLFAGSALAVVAGAVASVSAIALAISNDVFILSGADITGIHPSVLGWSLLALGIAGAVAIAAGLVAGLASWIGALIVTWQAETKTWFAVLLLLGIFNLGFLAMIGYLVAGPDRPARPTRPITASSVA